MIVIFCKKMGNDTRTDKTTFFIKWYCKWAISCSYLQNSILLSVFLNNKINQGFCISFPLIFRSSRNIFYFKHSISFIGNDALAFNPIII